MFGRGLFDTAVKFDEQIIEIQKNVGMTPEEARAPEMKSEIRASSPTKIIDLGAIVVDAKLGFATKVHIKEFVETMDQFIVYGYYGRSSNRTSR